MACAVVESGNDDNVERAKHDLTTGMQVQRRGMRLLGDPEMRRLEPDVFVPDGPEPGYAPKPGLGVLWAIDYGKDSVQTSVSITTHGPNSPIAGRDVAQEPLQ